MATQLQIRRGTTAQMSAFTGAEGELAVNTSTDTVHVHDGSTAGGHALAKADGSNIGTYAGSFTTISASGAITGNVTGNLTGSVTGNVTGDVTGDLTGSVLTAAQTNITSVGTLSTLAVTGTATAGSLLTTGAIASTAVDGTVVDRSGNTSRFVAGRAGGNYAGLEMHVAGASGVTKRFSIDYDSTTKLFAPNGTSEHLVVTSAGSVGIGTSSPRSVTNYSVVGINGTSGSAIDFELGEALKTTFTQTAGQFEINVVPALPLIFKTSNTEAYRITAARDMYFGQTAGSSTAAGHIIEANGKAFHIADGNNPLHLARLTSDGAIQQFYKGSTLVGSIGVVGGNNLYIHGDTIGLGIGDDNIYSTNSSGTATDAVTDIGDSSVRFKDLYLSGGAYLGGIDAAHKLEDYEEGTWTPSNTGNITVNQIHNATYTKIGRQVSVSAWLKVNITSANGTLGGLPFQVSGRGTASISNLSQQENFYNQGLGSTIYFYGATTTGTNDDLLLSFTYDS